jgi:hypothetical protein
VPIDELLVPGGGQPRRISRPSIARARVVRAPVSNQDDMQVALVNYSASSPYDVPADQWMSVPGDLPAKGDLCAVLFDDEGDCWVAAWDALPTVLAGGTNTIWTTTGPPAPGTGNDGDFAIDPAAWIVYGPKAAGAWPAGTSMKGPKGDSGDAGRSAYQVWLDAGNVGDVNAYLAAIKGPKGDKGDKGDQGIQGDPGPSGASTFVSGSGPPGAGVGVDGSIYLDYTNRGMWGPKASGAWPAAAFAKLLPLSPSWENVRA